MALCLGPESLLWIGVTKYASYGFIIEISCVCFTCSSCRKDLTEQGEYVVCAPPYGVLLSFSPAPDGQQVKMTPAQLDLALGYIAPYGVWSNQLLIIFENSAEDKQPSLAQPTGHGIHHSRFIRAKGKISEENKREHTRQGVPSSCTEYGGQALARNFTEAPGNSVMVLRSGGDRPP